MFANLYIKESDSNSRCELNIYAYTTENGTGEKENIIGGNSAEPEKHIFEFYSSEYINKNTQYHLEFGDSFLGSIEVTDRKTCSKTDHGNYKYLAKSV